MVDCISFYLQQGDFLSQNATLNVKGVSKRFVRKIKKQIVTGGRGA